MGIFDFFKKGKDDKKKPERKPRLVENSFDKPAERRDVFEPNIENGILKSVLNHNIKNGVFVIPREVNSIVSFAFMNCDNLETLVMHDGLRNILTGAFSGCPNLKKVVGFEKQRELKSVDGFAKCKSLESIKLPEITEVIANSAFKDCVKLKSVNIPQGCWCIADHAFDNCKALEYVEIPHSVSFIGIDAFRGCYDLTVVFADKPEDEVEDVYSQAYRQDDELEIDSGAFAGVKNVCARDVKVIEKVIESGFRGYVSYYDEEKQQIITIDLNMIENLYFDSVEGEDEEEVELDVALIDELYNNKFGGKAKTADDEEFDDELEEDEFDEDEYGDELDYE